VKELVLRLRDARELFEQPDRSPLDPDFEPWCIEPAAEYLVQVFRSSREHVVVEVPEPERAEAALARFAAAQAEHLAREAFGDLKRGLLTLIPTGAIFALTLALSRLAVASGSHWISQTVSDALIVIGWVVLWLPVAILGTDVWVLIGRRRSYTQLASGRVEFRSP